MNMSEFAGKAFIGVDDLPAPLVKTICAIEESQYNRPVLVFEDGSRVSLNITNTGRLLKQFGESDHDWVGKRVRLSTGLVKYQGTEKTGVVVRAVTSSEQSSDDEQQEAIPF